MGDFLKFCQIEDIFSVLEFCTHRIVLKLRLAIIVYDG